MDRKRSVRRIIVNLILDPSPFPLFDQQKISTKNPKKISTMHFLSNPMSLFVSLFALLSEGANHVMYCDLDWRRAREAWSTNFVLMWLTSPYWMPDSASDCKLAWDEIHKFDTYDLIQVAFAKCKMIWNFLPPLLPPRRTDQPGHRRHFSSRWFFKFLTPWYISRRSESWHQTQIQCITYLQLCLVAKPIAVYIDLCNSMIEYDKDSLKSCGWLSLSVVHNIEMLHSTEASNWHVDSIYYHH